MKYAILLAALASACGPTTKKKAAPPAGARAGDATEPAQSNTVKPEDVIGKDASLLKATFAIDAKAAGASVCKGAVQIRLSASLGAPKAGDAAPQLFQVPHGIIDCGAVGEIDLAEILGGFAGAEPPPSVADPLVVKNDVIAMKQLGFAKFEPPRPLLPSFLAASPEDLAKLDVKVKTKVTDTKADESASGTVRLRTLAFNDSYKPQHMERTFKKVLRFEIVNEGFDGVDKVGAFLFDRMEFRISLDPIAILSLKLEGVASDLVVAGKAAGIAPAGASGNSAVDAVVGAFSRHIDVRLAMDLMSQEALEDDAKAGDDEEDEGPKIGLR